MIARLLPYLVLFDAGDNPVNLACTRITLVTVAGLVVMGGLALWG